MPSTREYDDRIIEFVRANPGATSYKVARALHLSAQKTAGVLLKRLADEGRLTRARARDDTKTYMYTVPDVPLAPVAKPISRGEQLVLDFLGKNPGTIQSVIVAKLRASRGSMEARLSSLIERKLVVRHRERPGMPYAYSLAPKDPGQDGDDA